MTRRYVVPQFATLLSAIALACTGHQVVPTNDSQSTTQQSPPGVAANSQSENLPPDATMAPSRLANSPRHGEFVTIPTGNGDSLRTWIVYPERSTKAPVILVVHEI